MRRNLFLIISVLMMLISYSNTCSQIRVSRAKASLYTVDLARMFCKDLYTYNGVDFFQPLVKALNSTSNTRFISSAYIPSKVKNPYFKVSLNGMVGFASSLEKTFVPRVPEEDFNQNEFFKYINVNIFTKKINITDTAGFINYFFRVIIKQGKDSGFVKVPSSSPTVLGNGFEVISMQNDKMLSLVHNNYKQLYDTLPVDLKNKLDDAIGSFPNAISLLKGENMDYLYSGIPQVEIGSLFGTELLLRWIPSVNYGRVVGDFGFWGVGLKHSLSQYFGDKLFSLALQGVYQGTSMRNQIAENNAVIEANATFWDVNLQASKRISLSNTNPDKYFFEIYTGISYEKLDLKADYTFYLPIQVQYSLGMVEAEALLDEKGNLVNAGKQIANQIIEPWWVKALPVNPNYPGDTQPQTSSLQFYNTNSKFVIGLSATVDPVSIFIDYNVSFSIDDNNNKFNLLTFGLQVKI